MSTAAPYIVGGLLVVIFACIVLLALCLARIAKDPRISINDEIRTHRDAEREDAWEGFTKARKRWDDQHEVASFSTEASPERVITTRRAA